MTVPIRARLALGAASALALALLTPGAAIASDPCDTTPSLSGSFIQPDLIDGWTNTELAAQLADLQDACIDTQILQWTADSKPFTTVYDTTLSGYTRSSTTDVVERLLDAADTAGTSVFLGLQVNPDWFDLGVSDASWLAGQESLAKDLADDLYDLYGAADSLAGWYLPFEVDNLNFPTSTQWAKLGDFYDELTSYLHTLTPGLPVAVAPFYNNDLAGTLDPDDWEDMWEAILADAEIDIIALQDGVGAGHASTGDLYDWFAATRDAIDTARPSTQLISDVETFVFGASGLQPMGIDLVVDDMDAVATEVDGFWSFSYDHYQAPQTAPAAYHDTYLDYLSTGVVDATAPGVPTSLSATSAGAQSITLSWTAPTDNVGVAGYEIYRGGSLVAVILGSSPGWSDSQLSGSTTYSYTVRAFDGAGNRSAAASTVSATTAAAPTYSNTWSTGKSYTSTVAAHPSYPDTGGSELTDGVRGAALYGAAWQGRNAPGTYAFTLDLGAVRSIGAVESGWLQVRQDYVFLPPKVTIATSNNGVSFTDVGTITLPPVTDALQVKSYILQGLSASARYVRVTVDGGSAWTMLDEVVVRG